MHRGRTGVTMIGAPLGLPPRDSGSPPIEWTSTLPFSVDVSYIPDHLCAHGRLVSQSFVGVFGKVEGKEGKPLALLLEQKELPLRPTFHELLPGNNTLSGWLVANVSTVLRVWPAASSSSAHDLLPPCPPSLRRASVCAIKGCRRAHYPWDRSIKVGRRRRQVVAGRG